MIIVYWLCAGFIVSTAITTASVGATVTTTTTPPVMCDSVAKGYTPYYYYSFLIEITTSNYPVQYNGVQGCKYTVKAPLRHCLYLLRIRPLFTESSHKGCGKDHLVIWHNEDCETYCVNQIPHSKDIYSNEAVIFVPDTIKEAADGFKMKVFIMRCVVPHKVSTGSNGTIVSPGYPNGYPNDLDYTWRLTLANNTGVRLTQQDFHLQRSNGLRTWQDYLKITEEFREEVKPIKRYYRSPAGISGLQLVFVAPQVTLNLITDGSITDKGFKLKYTSFQISCGSQLPKVPAGEHGILHSPGYPNTNYPNDLVCVWTLPSQSEQSDGLLYLYFSIIDLEGLPFETIVLDTLPVTSSECLKDYIEVTEFGWETKRMRYCGRHDLPLLVSVPEGSKIVFVTDSNNTFGGFDMRYFSREHPLSPYN